jgi:hypothetical protein
MIVTGRLPIRKPADLSGCSPDLYGRKKKIGCIGVVCGLLMDGG